MNPLNLLPLPVSRRSFLEGTGLSVGAAALSALGVGGQVFGADPKSASRGVVNPLHFAPKAKRVIWLCMAGGPSHLETFDYKPTLAKMHGQGMPESITKGQPIAQLQGNSKLSCFGPQHPFKKYGQSGQEICEIFPKLGEVSDEICILRGVKTEAINHDPAHTFMNTGSSIPGRPSMGSWITYGLGAETENLPGFVVLTSTGRYGQSQPIAARQWHSGFLPSKYQGVHFRSKGEPVLYVASPNGVDKARQGDIVETLNALNKLEQGVTGDPEIATRIAQYEMAFRMQASVPDLVEIKDEPAHVLDAYGAKPGDGSYASNCLLARRLAERGVRFIQLYHRDWDHHGGLKDSIAGIAKEVDQPTAALIQDLKQRDMLKDTLIVYGGEFGRTPMAQGNGRDHHMKGFSMFLCGGGIKGGISYGGTDEFGYNAVTDVTPVHDIHATMLHLLGVDHLKLTVPFQGRDMRLTDISGAVVKKILA